MPEWGSAGSGLIKGLEVSLLIRGLPDMSLTPTSPPPTPHFPFSTLTHLQKKVL